jgi:hypothetical protein
MKPIVRPATPEDCAFIARHLREPDRLEVMAANGGRPPIESLLQGVQAGPAYVWEAGRDPCVLFGAVPLSAVCASIWMVGTPGLYEHRRFLLRHARSWVDALNTRWPLLVNMADGRNAVHHAFIRALGFTFIAERRINGLQFIEFVRTLPPCVNHYPSPSAHSPSRPLVP